MKFLHGVLRDEMDSTLRIRPIPQRKLTYAEYVPFVILSALIIGLAAIVIYLI